MKKPDSSIPIITPELEALMEDDGWCVACDGNDRSGFPFELDHEDGSLLYQEAASIIIKHYERKLKRKRR